jgi:hypothetical protein
MEVSNMKAVQLEHHTVLILLKVLNEGLEIVDQLPPDLKERSSIRDVISGTITTLETAKWEAETGHKMW